MIAQYDALYALISHVVPSALIDARWLLVGALLILSLVCTIRLEMRQ